MRNNHNGEGLGFYLMVFFLLFALAACGALLDGSDDCDCDQCTKAQMRQEYYNDTHENYDY